MICVLVLRCFSETCQFGHQGRVKAVHSGKVVMLRTFRAVNRSNNVQFENISKLAQLLIIQEKSIEYFRKSPLVTILQ